MPTARPRPASTSVHCQSTHPCDGRSRPNATSNTGHSHHQNTSRSSRDGGSAAHPHWRLLRLLARLAAVEQIPEAAHAIPAIAVRLDHDLVAAAAVGFAVL